MPLNDCERMYGDLAWAWPIISPSEDYAEEASQFMTALEGRSKIPVRNVLHMGCGGGHLDFHLKPHYRVTGLDISPDMLENAKRMNPEVRYLAGDMRTARLGEKFDAVMIADSIMYMLSEEDMLAAFGTAFAHLKPGGAFCTYAEELAEKFTRATYSHEPRSHGGLDITLIEHKWDPDIDDTTIEFLFVFLLREGADMRVETDRHTCGLFTLQTWKRLLRKAGFRVKASRGHEVEMFFACLK